MKLSRLALLAGVAAALAGCTAAGTDAVGSSGGEATITTQREDQTALIRLDPALAPTRIVYDAARAWSEGERDRYLAIGGPGATFESTWRRTFASARFVSALGDVRGGSPGDREALGAVAGATLDVQAGRLIALRELWADDRDYGASARRFEKALEPLVLEAARRALDLEELDSNLADMIAEEIRPDFTLYPAWALAPSGEAGRAGGIVVRFAPYRLAGVQPALEVVAPVAAIRTALRPDLADQFEGGRAALEAAIAAEAKRARPSPPPRAAAAAPPPEAEPAP
jgi:hypothetical protein